MNTTLRRIGVAVTAGSATLLPLGFTLMPSPADAALLEFNFTTQQGGTGSFTLDTSIQDTNPDIRFGIFPRAISNFTFNGTRPAASTGGLIVTGTGIFSDNGIQFRISSAAYGGPFEPVGVGPVSQVLINFSSPDDPNFLSPFPDQYTLQPTQAGAVLFSTGGSPQENINSITVRAITIPEPSSLLGLLSFAALCALSASHSYKSHQGKRI